MLRAALFLALSATPALAECPTAADLSNGIHIRENNGTLHLFKDLGNGVVEQTGTYTDGYTFRTLLGKGVHILQLADTENGQVLTDSISNTAYPVSPAQLPIPQASSRWEVDTTINSFGDIYAEKQVQTWGRVAPQQIGSCTYDAIPGKVTYTSATDVIEEALIYLPDLQIALLVGYDIQDDGDPAERYSYTEIYAAK